MIKKLIAKWKHEWLVKHEAEIRLEYASQECKLVEFLKAEISRNISIMEIERDTLYAKTRLEIQKGEVLEEEVRYRLKNLEDRKLELIEADKELKLQIKVIEAKSHPSGVWTEAFTLGMNKCWELMLPIMSENLEKVKLKLKEDAAKEAIGRFNAANKK